MKLEGKFRFDCIVTSVNAIQHMLSQVVGRIQDHIAKSKVQYITIKNAVSAQANQNETLHTQLAECQKNLQSADAQIEKVMSELISSKTELKSLRAKAYTAAERQLQLSTTIEWLQENCKKLIVENQSLRIQIQVEFYAEILPVCDDHTRGTEFVLIERTMSQ